MQQNNIFFSIIIPAHNEELYIADTLKHIVSLEYPKEYFEVFVIENASTDTTLAIAKNFVKENIQVVSIEEKGTSKAKNIGIQMISAASDWTVFLDADTLLEKDFLKDVNTFLLRKKDKNYGAGIACIKPISKKLSAKIWFSFYNLGHRLTRTPYSMKMVKSSFLKDIQFKEELTMGEDINLMDAVLKKGVFFYFKTPHVYASVRRFEKEGWWKIFFLWTFVAVLPTRFKKNFTYKVVR